MTKKGLFGLFAAILLVLVSISAVTAAVGEPLDLNIVSVEVDEDDVTDDEVIRTNVQKNDEMDIKIRIESGSNETAEDVQISATILGDEHFIISDTTDTFDVEPGVVYTKKMKLILPDIMDQDDYKLRILVADRYSALNVYNYNLQIDAEKHYLKIEDVSFTPGTSLEAGKNLFATVRLENLGKKDEDSIKVQLEVPELGLKAVDYIDELEGDDSISSEELYMRIPDCAEAGSYKAYVTVLYDDGFEKVEDVYTIKVKEGQYCNADTPSTPSSTQEEKTLIVLGATSQAITAGEGGASYPITISNTAAASKTYTLTVTGTEGWADVSVKPSNVVLVNGGQSSTAYLYVAAKEDASVGSKVFTVVVSDAAGNQLEQLALNADVTEGDNDGSVTKGLEIGLIVLLVILVIIGLVVLFSKMKGKESGDDLESDTYY